MNRYNFVDSKGEHYHSLDGRELIGCTTALGVLGKGGLTWWASGMALGYGFGWLNPKKNDPADCRHMALETLEKIKKLSIDDYMKLLADSYKAHNTFKNKKAKEGIDAHELCELWIKSILKGKEIEPDKQIEPFVLWCRKNVRRFLWSELHVYSETLWTGGICDFGYEDVNGNYGIGDIKNRDKFYPADIFQCGGYDIMLAENSGGFDANGEKIFELTKPVMFHAGFPLVGFKEPEISYNVKENKETFAHALAIYKAIQFVEKGVK